MPADRTLGEDLAGTLTDLYASAAERIAAAMAMQLRQGINRPDWAADKLGSINDLRNAIAQIVRALNTATGPAVEQAMVLAFARGGKAALDELAKAGYLTAEQLTAIRMSVPGAEAVARLAFSLTSTLQGTHVRILRWALDTYREVIARTTPDVLLGTKTRLRAAQTAWEELLSQGITGFTDRAGRNWQLASYVEMATRTATAQAAVQAHLDRLGDAGIDLVIVSNAPQECKRCRPWEGKILARNGPGGKRVIELPHATKEGHTVRIEIAGSVEEAVAAGLMHPNCRHSLSAYLPGVTKSPTHTEDPEGDEARQKLRQLERDVRKAKAQAAAVIDPAARKVFEAQVRDKQAQIRDHIASAPTTLFRQPQREQIGTAR
jgi:phosphoglycolate phosphatase-like HAD superfamily hydrolase